MGLAVRGLVVARRARPSVVVGQASAQIEIRYQKVLIRYALSLSRDIDRAECVSYNWGITPQAGGGYACSTVIYVIPQTAWLRPIPRRCG